MHKPATRHTALLTTCLSALLLLASCPRNAPAEVAPNPGSQPENDAHKGVDPLDASLSIHIFTLGQADSLLVLGPAPQRRSLLIDLGSTRGGDRKNHLRVADRIEALSGRRQVDYFLVSHFHADHVGMAGRGKGKPKGMFALLADANETFRIGTWLDRGDSGEEFAPRTKPHKDLIANIEGWIAAGRVGGREVPALGVGAIDLGRGVTIDVLSVNGRRSDGASALAAVEAKSPGNYADAPASENDFSIALLIRSGEFEFFTAGDLTGAAWPGDGKAYPASTRRSFGRKSSTYTNVESWLVEDWRSSDREMDVEVYRANHHGSAYSSNQDLLGALDPEFIIYSCGGLYGHPAPEVVQRGAKTARQLVTYAASLSSWPSGLPPQLATLIGEISIQVAGDGGSYTIAGEPQPAYSDADEAQDKDQRP